MMLNSDHPKGTTNMVPNINTHFMTVTVEYLDISGFTMIRNTANDNEFININTSPKA